jgi:hypothetical protein
VTKRATKGGKILWLAAAATRRILPASLGWVLGFPELGVVHYFFEIVVI